MALPRAIPDAIAEDTGDAVDVTGAEGGITPGVKYLVVTGDCGYLLR